MEESSKENAASSSSHSSNPPASSPSPKKAPLEGQEDPIPLYEPPPPYIANPNVPPNPGFCSLAFAERQNNRLPNGGMAASEYYLPCQACSVVCGSNIPISYKTGWMDWVDPSVNFRWESHTGTATIDGEKKELLGCWICWEYDGKWVKPMFVEEWYLHLRKHFRTDGYRVCKGKVGAMQRRRNCMVGNCPKIHS